MEENECTKEKIVSKIQLLLLKNIRENSTPVARPPPVALRMSKKH